MDDFYQEQIVDHYKNPRNFGEVKGADVVARESNASCGDLVEISLKLSKEEVIEEVGFKGVGCAISTASTSMLLEKIKGEGLSLEEAANMGEGEMGELLGVKVTPTRMKCVMLPVRALRKGKDEFKKNS